MQSSWVEAKDFGGTDVLSLTSGETGLPKPGELLIKQHAVGVNFIDILQRRGELGAAKPYRLGLEAAGEVLAVGSGTADFKSGDRIVYAGGPQGAYADVRSVPAARCVKLPTEIGYEEAAAVFFKGLTADYLVNRLWRLSPGDAVLFTASAGGVASLAIPLLKAAGIKVIGTVSRIEKVRFAQELGCDLTLVLPEERDTLVDKVLAFTDGRGVAVAYDSIGRVTFDLSLACVRRFGLLVSYGWSSGDVPPVALARARDQGSIFVTRPTVSHYTEQRDELLAGARRLFDAMAARTVHPVISSSYALADAGEAHSQMEQGLNAGSIILVPSDSSGRTPGDSRTYGSTP